MEKDDLLDLELKIDELKSELEGIHSELSDIKSEVRALENIRSELSDIKNEIPDINKLKSLHERTNEILDRIANGTDMIKVFGWVLGVVCIISFVKGCFGGW